MAQGRSEIVGSRLPAHHSTLVVCDSLIEPERHLSYCGRELRVGVEGGSHVFQLASVIACFDISRLPVRYRFLRRAPTNLSQSTPPAPLHLRAGTWRVLHVLDFLRRR